MARICSRRPILILLRRAAAALLITLGLAGVAGADTLIMPKRVGVRNEPIVLWGVTTLPNHNTGTPVLTTTFRFIAYDGTSNTVIASGNVTGTTERSYINVAHTFAAAGTYLVTLEVTRGTALPETATVEVGIVDPATFAGPGTKVLPIGPGSNEQFRNLRINMAIQDGLRYLWTSQTNRAANFDLATTNWSSATWWTAMVVTAFENHGYRLPANPAEVPTGVYERFVVQRGLKHIIDNLEEATLSSKTLDAFGNPCVGVGIENVPSPAPPATAIRFTCTGLTETASSAGYTIGIAMMPLAASSALNRTHNSTVGPVVARNKTYREILQRLANSYAFGQHDTAPHRGGWGYAFNDNRFDGSVMGWAILGLLDAQVANIVVPDWVEDELEIVLNAGTINDNGSFDYNVNASNSFSTTHMSKAGIPLQGLFMVAREDDSAATKAANQDKIDRVVTYIRNRWTFNAFVANNGSNSHISDTYQANCGAFFNRGCAYSMFNIFKGLKLQKIATLPGPMFRAAGPGSIPENDWHADYEDYLVNNQLQGPTGGHWAGRTTPAPAIPASMFFSPQGTNDVNGNAAIAELLLAGVALVLPDGEKFATIGLSPSLTTLVEGNTVTVTAKAESSEGAPVPGATVGFTIIEGVNAGAFSGTSVTDANGLATFIYTDPGPVRSYGTDRIRANIGTLLSNIVEVVWLPFNRAPVANADTFTVNEDGSLTGNVLTNDTDLDNDPLTTALAGPAAAHGTVALNIDGTFTYTPQPNFCGTDAFSYDANDSFIDSNVAVVTIQVQCVNDAPVRSAPLVMLPAIVEDATDPPGNAAAEIIAAGAFTDIDLGDVVSVAVVGVDNAIGTWQYSIDNGASWLPLSPVTGTNARLLDPAARVRFVPNADANGSAMIVVRGWDQTSGVAGALANSTINGGSTAFSVTTVTVTILVTAVNDAPVAIDASASTDEDTPVTGAVSSNDIDGGAPSYVLSSAPSHGTVVLNEFTGAFTYTPAENYFGADAFGFAVSDGNGGTDTGDVTLTVAPLNDSPVADDASAGGSEDTVLSGSVSSTDVDGGAPKYAVSSPPSHGAVVLNEDTGAFSYTPAANYYGPDAFSFSVADGNGGTDSGDVTLLVAPVNDPPVPNDSSDSTAEDTPGDGTVGGADIDGDALTYLLTDPPDHGTVVLNPDGSYLYTPELNYHGTDSFSFSVFDGTETVPGGDVSFVITAVNDAPSPNDSTDSTTEDTPGGGSAGASDVDGDALTYALTDPPAHGTVVFNADGTYVYTPDPNYNGADAFSFSVSDGTETVPGGDVTFTITAVNDAPVPSDTSDTTAEDTPGDGQAGATDLDGDTLTYLLTDAPDHGTVVFNPDGSYVYTPEANYHGADSFSFSVSDGTETVAGGDVSFVITAVNDAPLPNDSTDSTAEDTPGDGSAGASDVDSDALTYALTDPPDHGTVVFNADGTYLYTPNANYTGPDTFSFSVSDGTETVPGGDVTFTVTAVNDAPVPNDGTDTTAEDTPGTGNVGASDPDGDTLTFVLTDPPDHGTVVLNPDGSYVYTPNPDYNGSDAFSFSVSDGTETVAGGDVSFVITAVNDAPVPNDSSDSTAEDTPGDGSAGANDVDGDTLTYLLTDPPDHGTVVFNADGTYVYTPNANYTGSDAFSFSVSDGTETVPGGDVTFTVTAVNDAPVPNDGTDTTAEDTPGTGNVGASDPDGDTLTFVLTDPPDHGTVVLNPDGSYVYTPNPNFNGSDAFSFSVSDGTQTVPGGDVSLTITAVNDPPVPNDSTDTTPENTAGTGNAGATDVDGDTLTYLLTDPPDHGTVVFNPDGSYTYTPAPNYNGPDSFSFSVSDGTEIVPGGDVSFDVIVVNSPPVPNQTTDTTPEDTAGTGNAGATDPDGDTLTYVLTDPPDHGTVVFNPDGSYVYSPAPNYNGTDSFSFSVTDGAYTVPGGTVSFVISAVNDPPVPNDSSANTAEDTPRSGNAGATDVDGDALTYVLTDPPDHGTVVFNPDGSYVYTPVPNYNGGDAFSFAVSDGTVTIPGGDVSFAVTSVNDPPVCTAAAPSLGSLWPPDHTLVDINVLGVVDPVEGGAITIEVTGIFQDEPTNTIGDGNTLVDGYGIGTSTASVRRERSGSKRVPGDGRMYYISFTGSDGQGGQCTGTIKVGVPHDLGKDVTIGDGGPLYKSTGQ